MSNKESLKLKAKDDGHDFCETKWIATHKTQNETSQSRNEKMRNIINQGGFQNNISN